MGRAMMLVILSGLLMACGVATPSPDISAIQTQVIQDFAATLTAEAPTATAIPTNTPVPTSTPTPRPTHTPTKTPSPTPTPGTPTATFTPTATTTPTHTPTPTYTATPQPTPTPRPPTPIPTNTPTLDEQYPWVDPRELDKNPNKYFAVSLRMAGTIFNIDELDGTTFLQMWGEVPGDSWALIAICVYYTGSLPGAYEDTRVVVYGYGGGTFEGTNPMGGTIIQPVIFADQVLY